MAKRAGSQEIIVENPNWPREGDCILISVSQMVRISLGD